MTNGLVEGGYLLFGGGNPICKMIEHLKNIETGILKLVDESYERTNEQGWSHYRKGKFHIYEQTVVYAGSDVTVNLDLSYPVQFNRVEQIWNDATAKTFSLRMYTNPATAYYIELDAATANTSTSRLLQLGAEYGYSPSSRFSAYHSAFTAGKICKIVVATLEL